MTWIGFSYFRSLDTAFTSNRMNTKDNQMVIKIKLFQFFESRGTS